MAQGIAYLDPGLAAWIQRCVRQAQAVHSAPPATDPTSPHGHLCLLCQQVWEHADRHCTTGEACLCLACYHTAGAA